jgi:4-hydroxyphenylpyruvate dioxygenase
MGKIESLGIRGIEAIHYYVRDLERSRRFYTERMDFQEVGQSDRRLTEGGHQRSVVFEAGACRVVCSSPVGQGGRAQRFLDKHPDGVGSIIFEVEDIERTFELLEKRGGTPVHRIEGFESQGGKFKTFVLATPFGDTSFRFVERSGDFPLYPGIERYASPKGGTNAFGFSHFDHVTSNFETMSPALLWMEHVLGFERYWDVEFHTKDVVYRTDDSGSGLRSVVMWDSSSGAKFANNEPYRPNFKASQINIFHEEHKGDGVQHVALAVGDIISAVRGLRGRGVEFMHTPKAYYELLPERLAELHVGSLDEPVSDLEQLEILVDGNGNGRYLLQIFLKDSAGFYNNPEAGPFFYEII